MQNEKYKLFTQYMYNELGITKDDIREWTHEAVELVARDYVAHKLSEKSFDDRIKDIIKDQRYGGLIHTRIPSEIAKILSENLEVSFKDEKK